MYSMEVVSGLVYVLFLMDTTCDGISLPAPSFLVRYLSMGNLAAGV